MAASGATPPALSLERRIPGTAEAVRDHLEAVEDLARRAPMTEDGFANVLIVLGEVLNNIVEHALADIPDGWIACKLRQDRARIYIETCDNGSPLPPRLLALGELPDMGAAIEELPEGGFGWFIVHTLADDMMYERFDGENKLSFSMRIA